MASIGFPSLPYAADNLRLDPSVSFSHSLPLPLIAIITTVTNVCIYNETEKPCSTRARRYYTTV